MSATHLREIPNDHPSHVQETLYSILTKYAPSQCCCSHYHESRLRLQDGKLPNGDDVVLFDAVFSRRPPKTATHEIEWQQVQFQISRKKSPRGVDFVDDSERSGSADISPKASHECVKIGTVSHFCDVLAERVGPAKIRFKVSNGNLERYLDPDQVEDDIAPEPSIPLTTMLAQTHLVSRKKLILAYILANSFCKYYSSDWVASRWTAESVQFFRRGVADDDEDEESALKKHFLEDSPYFSLAPVRDDFPALAEFLESGGYLHRYPRLLAFGAILVEIGRKRRQRENSRAQLKSFSSAEDINQCFQEIKRALKHKSWPELDLHEEAREVYRLVVENCANPRIFQDDSEQASMQQGNLTTEERRAVIYKKVVVPLRVLLEKFEWVDKSGRVRNPNDDIKTTRRDKAALLNAGQGNFDPGEISRRKAERWLNNIQESEVNKSLCASFKEKRYLRRIRVAVLDTGHDPSSIFFKAPDRKRRIQDWIDYVDPGPKRCSDTDGHGTHVLSLIMKVAPAADIYVARVARGTADLISSSENIAEAIIWAAKNCQADIISMSFGFDEEIVVNDEPVISNAISEALKIRNQRILFFAAAANEGGNQPEMFPAKHPQVISIRGTDDKGWLQRFNPPPDYEGASCFMTLGQDVPGAALQTDGGGEVCKSGTSVSTPIAAGIAAMLLGYARLYEGELKQKLSQEESWRSSELWKMNGMRKLFGALSTEMLERWHYLSAEAFIKKPHELRICMLALTV